jgi:hypothetical protein
MALLLLPLAAIDAQPNRAGDGFLFYQPQGSVTLRLGYDRANATGDVYSVQRRDLTIGPRGFDGLNWGVDFAFETSPRLDVGLTIDGNTRSRLSEYRAWQDNNNQPITQRTTLSMIAPSVNLRYNFEPAGRSISNFAWIPATYLPYVGIGGGFQYYELVQNGDFVDFSSPTKDIVNDRLHTDGFGALGEAFVGVERNLTPHIALSTEARYTLSSAKLHQDYQDLGNIDLSGLAVSVGTKIRF